MVQIAAISNDKKSLKASECGDVLKDGFGNTIGASANGGIGVPIGALAGQSLQIFDKPLSMGQTAYVAPGGGGNTDISLDLATLSGQPVPDNAVRAIIMVHNEFLHAFSTTGDKEADIWMDSYPSGGDYTGIDVDNNFVTRSFVAAGAKVDTADALTFVAITRSEGTNNIAVRLTQPANSQSYLWFDLVGYTLNEEGSSFVGKTVVFHRERLHQSAVVVGPSANADIGLTLSNPANQCQLPVGITHAWLHHIMRGQATSGVEAVSYPRIGAYPAGGDFSLLDPSRFYRSRTSNAPENFSEVVTGTSQLASTAPQIGYRMEVQANNQVNDRETHVSGYLIDDDPLSVSGMTYALANGHFLKTGTFTTGSTSVTVDLDLKALLAATPIPAKAKKAIIRLQLFGAHNSSTQDDTIDVHVDAYPASGNYSGFSTIDNKIALQLLKQNTGHLLSSGATPFVELNLSDGTNHVGVEFVKTTEATGEYFIWIEGFLLDETTAETANETQLKIDHEGVRIGSTGLLNLTGAGVDSVIKTANGNITINVLGPSSLDFYHAKLAAPTGTLAVNNKIVFDTLIVEDSSGGKIAQSTGVFTLQPGKYKLSAYTRVGDAATDSLDAQFWDVGGAVFIGMNSSDVGGQGSTFAFGFSPTAIAYVDISVAKTYELRVLSINGTPILYANGSHVTVEQRPS